MSDDKKPPEKDRMKLDTPAEGFSTLAAQFTSAVMERTIAMVQRMKASGLPKDIILNRVRQQIRQLDESSVELIYNRATGTPTQDTFKPEQIAALTEAKPGTIEIEFTGEAAAALQLGSVVQVKGDVYTVTRVTRKGFVFKKV